MSRMSDFEAAMLAAGATITRVNPLALARQVGSNSPPDPTVSEADFQQRIIDFARLSGWRVAHFRAARVLRRGKEVYETPVAADGKGWPDLVLVRDRVLWVEAKSATGKLSADQTLWREALIRAGGLWYCWRPEDWPEIVETLR